MKYSADTGWNDTALAHVFYNGLPNRIKDEMVHIGGHPRTFTDMKTIALIIDQQYTSISRRRGLHLVPPPTHLELPLLPLPTLLLLHHPLMLHRILHGLHALPLWRVPVNLALPHPARKSLLILQLTSIQMAISVRRTQAAP